MDATERVLETLRELSCPHTRLLCPGQDESGKVSAVCASGIQTRTVPNWFMLLNACDKSLTAVHRIYRCRSTVRHAFPPSSASFSSRIMPSITLSTTPPCPTTPHAPYPANACPASQSVCLTTPWSSSFTKTVKVPTSISSNICIRMDTRRKVHVEVRVRARGRHSAGPAP